MSSQLSSHETRLGGQLPTRRARMRRSVQLELPIPSGWGGRRAGAGRRPNAGRRRVPHCKRPPHRAEHPVHVTLRSACRSLRTQFVFPTLRNAISAANRRASTRFRIAQFSVQSDHLHLLVEAADRDSLVQGVRGLCIRIARRVNQLLIRRGSFFADRWHGRALTTPRAVRNALVYVLANFRKHHPGARAAIDPYSSAAHFQDFVEFPQAMTKEATYSLHIPLAPPDDTPIASPSTWLLSKGWKRHGKLSVSERPAR